MKARKPKREWKWLPEDLPPEKVLRKADYLAGLEENAVFRLLTYRSTPFWHRADFMLSLILALMSLGVAVVHNVLPALLLFSASGVIIYVMRMLQPDKAALDELTDHDLEVLLPTRVGVRDIALGIWGVRTSQRWLDARDKAGRTAFWAGWTVLLLAIIPEKVFAFVIGWLPFGRTLDVQIVGMLLVAGGASLRTRLLAAPAHALPACLRVLDKQIQRIESRHQGIEYHATRILRLTGGAIGRFFVLLFWSISLILAAVFAGRLAELFLETGLRVYLPPDLQTPILGAIAWGVGVMEGRSWRRFVEPDMRRNYMELLDKVRLILNQERRRLTLGEVRQRFPSPTPAER